MASTQFSKIQANLGSNLVYFMQNWGIFVKALKTPPCMYERMRGGWGTRNWSGLKGRSWASSLLPFSQGLRPSVFPWYIVRPRTSYTCVCLRSQRITLSRRAHLVNFDLWILWKSLVCCLTCQYEFTIDHSTGCGPGPILHRLAHVSWHLFIW